MRAPYAQDEQERLKELKKLNLLDTPIEHRFERIIGKKLFGDYLI